jgi:hypothetical protein
LELDSKRITKLHGKNKRNAQKSKIKNKLVKTFLGLASIKNIQIYSVIFLNAYWANHEALSVSFEP